MRSNTEDYRRIFQRSCLSICRRGRCERRWGRLIGFSFLGLILVLVGGHGFWGWWEERKLNEEIGALRAKGEPMLIEELMNRPVAEGDNAVILLREAAEAVHEKSAEWQE